MITVILTDSRTGEQELVIGLSFDNLEKFREEPLETHALVSKERSHLPMNVRIISGPTEEAIKEFILKNSAGVVKTH